MKGKRSRKIVKCFPKLDDAKIRKKKENLGKKEKEMS